MNLSSLARAIESTSEIIPERRLALAVFARALRDLEEDIRKKQIATIWFTTPGCVFPDGYSYDDIKEICDLPALWTRSISKMFAGESSNISTRSKRYRSAR